MPKRVLDGEAMWGSTKLSECPEWAIPYYAWLYPLADANGSFELTNLRVLWCKVAAILPHLTLDTFAEIIGIFENLGLLFTWWTEDGKRYGHWTGSEKPGRLPQPSRRQARYGPLFAPPIPQPQLLDYQLRQTKRRTATDKVSPVLVLGLDLGLEGVKEGAPENGAPAAQAKPRPSPSAFSGTHLTVSTKQDHVIAEAFPWVDRQVEYRKIDSWLEANPRRRPKKNSFVHNWFARISAPNRNGKGVIDADERTRRNITAAGLAN